MSEKSRKERPERGEEPGEDAVRRNLKRIFGKLAFEKGPAGPDEKRPEEEGKKTRVDGGCPPY